MYFGSGGAAGTTADHHDAGLALPEDGGSGEQRRSDEGAPTRRGEGPAARLHGQFPPLAAGAHSGGFQSAMLSK